jgi:hypothetical protein
VKLWVELFAKQGVGDAPYLHVLGSLNFDP